MGVLETAMKIANQDADAEDEEGDGPTEAAKVKQNIKALPNGQIVIVQPRNFNCLWTKLRNALLCPMPFLWQIIQSVLSLLQILFLSLPLCFLSCILV